MSFEDILQSKERLERVGPLRLRYEPSLLIAEPRARPRPARAAELARLAGLLAMVAGAVGALLPSPGGIRWSSVAAALFGAAAFLLAPRLGRAGPAHRFVLNFATESLRVDRLAGAGLSPVTWVVHFDQIQSAEVIPAAGGRFALELRCRPGAAMPSPLLLVGGVAPEEIDALRRLWRLLSDAFGLSRPGAPLRG